MPPLASKLRVLGAAFNEEAECFAIGHERGFRVYNSDPMEAWVSREFDGGVQTIAMLHRTNFVALVGGGDRPQFAANKLVLWDDIKESPAMTLEFARPIINVLLSRTRVLVVLNDSVHLYTLASPPQQLSSYQTAENPEGAAAISGLVAVFPASVAGRIQVVDLESGKVQHVIRAHKSRIKALALHGPLVASASTTGTIIRLFDVRTAAPQHEFRRGLDRAEIYSLSLGNGNLAVLSDKATLHVFRLGPAHTTAPAPASAPASAPAPAPAPANRTHMLRRVPIAQRYFGSEWSYASCATECDGRGILGWVQGALVVVWLDAARWEKYVVLGSNELVKEAWRRFEP